MKTEKKLNGRERVYLLNLIAEQNAAHEAEIAEKDRLIDYYRRTAEIATERRIRERHDRSERRKDIIAWAVLAVLTGCVALPATLYALTQFWNWANGVV